MFEENEETKEGIVKDYSTFFLLFFIELLEFLLLGHAFALMSSITHWCGPAF